jgi:hypothetical protein
MNRSNLCNCGSGEPKRPACDARGIFVAYVCDACEQEKLSGYRRDVFTNPNYWHDEPIDEC